MKLIVSNKGARIFLHPGKGKTATVLKAFSVLKKMDMVDCMLVLAPLRVITTTWPAQLGLWEDFEHLRYTTIHGGSLGRETAMRDDVDVYLMNVEGLLTKEWRLGPKTRGYPCNPAVLRFLAGRRVMLVVDESTKFKNQNSQRYKVLKKYIPYFSRIVIMTGTPKPNKLEDVFAQCYLTDMGEDLGKYVTHFRMEYMTRDFNGNWTPQTTALERIAAKIAPTTLQLEDDEAIPTSEVDIWLPMPPEIKANYEELRKQFITSLNGRTIVAVNSAVLLGKLQQLVQGAIVDPFDNTKWVEGHGAKLDALESLLAELDGDPAFCLYNYRHDFARINQRLGYEVPRIGGGISNAQGAAFCMSFAAGDIPLLLGQPKSAAFGVDGLQQSCGNVIWFAQSWSWEENYQANRRVARMGSTRDQVFIYRIMVDCSVEHAIKQSVTGKRLSEEEFCSLLREYMA